MLPRRPADGGGQADRQGAVSGATGDRTASGPEEIIIYSSNCPVNAAGGNWSLDSNFNSQQELL